METLHAGVVVKACTPVRSPPTSQTRDARSAAYIQLGRATVRSSGRYGVTPGRRKNPDPSFTHTHTCPLSRPRLSGRQTGGLDRVRAVDGGKDGSGKLGAVGRQAWVRDIGLARRGLERGCSFCTVF